MKTNVKKKRVLILVASFVFTVLIIFSVWFLFFKGDEAENDGGIFYYPANFNEDIMQNSAYLSYQRDLLYGYGGIEQMYSYENDRDDATPECKFFLDYFHTLVMGDNEALVQCYVDGYFDEKPNITMQMIHEPYVLYHSTTKEEINGVETTLYNFHVRYAIFKNNGTFRKGIGSNDAVPQIYQLIKGDNGTYQIYRILEIEFKNEV